LAPGANLFIAKANHQRSTQNNFAIHFLFGKQGLLRHVSQNKERGGDGEGEGETERERDTHTQTHTEREAIREKPETAQQQAPKKNQRTAC